MILSPGSRPVQALIPNDVMPKWWRSGRHGSRPSLISSMSSRRATAYSLIDTPPGYRPRGHVVPRATPRERHGAQRAAQASGHDAHVARVEGVGPRGPDG